MKKHFLRSFLFMMLTFISITSFSFANTYDEVKKGNGYESEFVAISCDVDTTALNSVNLVNGYKSEFVAISCDVDTTALNYIYRYSELKETQLTLKKKLKQIVFVFRKARDNISL